MSVVVENEGELAVTLTEHDFLVVGVAEEGVPTWEQCALVLRCTLLVKLVILGIV